MSYFSETASSASGRHVNLYTGISAEELSKIVDAYFVGNRYKKDTSGSGSVTYTYGSRFMRIMFGAFCKYFKFIVAVRPINENTVELSISKDSTGFSGGAIGLNQVKNEFNKIKTYFGNI